LERLLGAPPGDVPQALDALLLDADVFDILTTRAAALARLIPEIAPAIGFAHNSRFHLYDVWTHTAHTIQDAAPDALVRLTLLFHDLGKPESYVEDEAGAGHFYGHEAASERLARPRLQALGYDTATIDDVCLLILWHDKRLDASSANEWLARFGDRRLRAMFAVKEADAKSHSPDYALGRLAELATARAQLEQPGGAWANPEAPEARGETPWN